MIEKKENKELIPKLNKIEVRPYNNVKATLALAKASFISIVKSPSSVVFSLLFPLIFILVFGFIGNSGISIDIGLAAHSDTSNVIFQGIRKSPIIKIRAEQTASDMEKDLEKGKLDAVLFIQKSQNLAGTPNPLLVKVKYTNASLTQGSVLRSLLTNILYKITKMHGDPLYDLVKIEESTVQGRVYKTIDFILPGQLGFSLLSTGVFGTAFIFLSLRSTLVIKRFFATPVKKSSILLGEALSRITFSLIGALIIILIGHFVFGFTLVKGVFTVLNLLLLSLIGIIVFMGFGFVVSGIAKTESAVPPLANIITLPQFLLAGTFFSVSAFPKWLQYVSNVLPLTYLNDAMRRVAFEGAGLLEISHPLLILGLWGIGIYALAIRVFKWE